MINMTTLMIALISTFGTIAGVAGIAWLVLRSQSPRPKAADVAKFIAVGAALICALGGVLIPLVS